MMAGAGEKEVQSFAEYGKSLGIAYQLKDDLLDWRSKDKVALCLLKTQSESAVVGKMTALAQTYAEAAKTQLLAFPRSEPIAFLQYLADLTLQRKS